MNVYRHVLMFLLSSLMNELHPQTASTGRIVKATSLIHCLQFQNKAQEMLDFKFLVQHISLLFLHKMQR